MKRPDFIPNGYHWFRGGSREICNPPPEDTDEDFFVLCRMGGADLRSTLRAYGFREHVSDDYSEEPTFNSWRKDHYNVILIQSPKHFGSIKTATTLAKRLNLQDKSQRIVVHEFMRELYENSSL